MERNQSWLAKPSTKQAIPAALAFKGEVYRSLEANSLEDDSIEYLKNNLFIISGLYGILRPTDKIMQYRLEMGTKLDINGSKNLYGFWKDVLTSFVNSKLKSGELILNLAS